MLLCCNCDFIFSPVDYLITDLNVIPGKTKVTINKDISSSGRRDKWVQTEEKCVTSAEWVYADWTFSGLHCARSTNATNVTPLHDRFADITFSSEVWTADKQQTNSLSFLSILKSSISLQNKSRHLQECKRVLKLLKHFLRVALFKIMQIFIDVQLFWRNY